MKNQALINYNTRYSTLVKSVAILGSLNYPDHAKRDFLDGCKIGNIKMPKFDFVKKDYSETKLEFKKLHEELKGSTAPELIFISENAESYVDALTMLESVGTSAITEISQKLYGDIYEPLPGYTKNSVAAAKYFLRKADKFKSEAKEDETYVMSSEMLKKYMAHAISKVFKKNEVTVEIDEKLASKASVSSSRVKIRANTVFQGYEARQLLHHEVFTHALCSINGASQKIMTSMEFTSPRITATQEGLAQYSELVTGSIHLSRLKRVALRIIALDMGLKGANFIDIYKYFLDQTGEEEESYLAAMRILRGCNPEGGAVFMKDGVYIKGMLELHSFFQKSLQENRLDDLKVLFAGKMTTKDVESFHGLSEQGIIDPPKYVPFWYDNIHNLAAILSFVQFATNLDVEAM